jgi:hypothetical protein
MLFDKSGAEFSQILINEKHNFNSAAKNLTSAYLQQESETSQASAMDESSMRQERFQPASRTIQASIRNDSSTRQEPVKHAPSTCLARTAAHRLITDRLSCDVKCYTSRRDVTSHTVTHDRTSPLSGSAP